MTTLYLIAQATTQPVGGIANWTAADWVLIIGAVTAAVVAWRADRKADSANATATEARVESAEAKGVTHAMQQSVTRLSNRQNAADVKVVDLAAAMPSQPRPPFPAPPHSTEQ